MINRKRKFTGHSWLLRWWGKERTSHYALRLCILLYVGAANGSRVGGRSIFDLPLMSSFPLENQNSSDLGILLPFEMARYINSRIYCKVD